MKHTTTRSPADGALQILLEGNQRFVSGKPAHPNRCQQSQQAAVSGQRPVAAILSCSDSRVLPVDIFDQGIGDLFVVRVAGTIIGTHTLGSIEYAVKHLEIPLIVVMAHSCCGVVGAVASQLPLNGQMASFVPTIHAALENCKDEEGDRVDNAAQEVARMVAAQITVSEPVIADYVNSGQVKVMPAFYDLASGVVTIL